jgi:glutamate-1-semialdehyde 2,1-aminomutase
MKTYRERLHKAIPGGAHTYSRGDDQFPANAPPILERGQGASVWDPEGREYLDYGMGLRSVTLGYANERVNQAAMLQMNKGMNLSRATTIELAAAELIIDLIPGAQMVKFAKNGSNVTTAAVKIARAYTDRKYICFPRQHPFFSFDDWFIGKTAITQGVPNEISSLSLCFDYNDIDSLKQLFANYPGQIAGVILEPATFVLPENDFLSQVRALCTQEGALLIFDEMITGFRWHIGGAQAYYGIESDLSTFGKAMANGFPLAALTGKRKYMDLGSIQQKGQERLFLLSTTHGAEMASLGAFIETMKVYQECGVIKHLWHYGMQLQQGMIELARHFGIQDYFELVGLPVSFHYITKDKQGEASMAMRTLFSQEMIKNSVMMPWIALSFAHQETQLQRTLEALEKTFGIYRQALELGVDKYLQGDVIKPVFRKHN